jgi:hypothetical protein
LNLKERPAVRHSNQNQQIDCNSIFSETYFQLNPPLCMQFHSFSVRYWCSHFGRSGLILRLKLGCDIFFNWNVSILVRKIDLQDLCHQWFCQQSRHE